MHRWWKYREDGGKYTPSTLIIRILTGFSCCEYYSSTRGTSGRHTASTLQYPRYRTLKYLEYRECPRVYNSENCESGSIRSTESLEILDVLAVPSEHRPEILRVHEVPAGLHFTPRCLGASVQYCILPQQSRAAGSPPFLVFAVVARQLQGLLRWCGKYFALPLVGNIRGMCCCTAV